MREAIGKFWLAGQDHSRAQPGVLKLHDKGATITLNGSLSGQTPLRNRTVFGAIAETPGKVTIYNCYTEKFRRYGLDEDQTSTTISGTCTIIGDHIEDPKFKEIRFNIPESARWFKDAVFSVTHDHEDKETISYKKEAATTIQIDQNTKIEKYYSHEYPFPLRGQEQITLNRKLKFSIQCNHAIDLDELWEKATHFKRMIEFFCQINLKLSDIELKVDTTEYHGYLQCHENSISIGHGQRYDINKELIGIDDISEKLDEVIKNWFKAKETSPEPFHRYFDAMRHGEHSHILSFLWLAGAIEELHKIKTKRTGNSFLPRLKEVYSTWDSITPLGDAESHLNKIKNSRHYYAHGAGDLRKKSAHDWELIRYGYFLLGLCNLEFILLIGLKEQEAKSLSRKNYLMMNYLSLSTVPEF